MIDQKSDKIEYKESNIQSNKLTIENVKTEKQQIDPQFPSRFLLSSLANYQQELMEHHLESLSFLSCSDYEPKNSSKLILHLFSLC